jgi:capsular polysaccharide biosynthesis protein/GGDEF domain-containing protein
VELRRYLQLVGRHSLLVVFVFALISGTTLFLVQRATPVYESTGTYIVRPSKDVAPDETVNSIDTLIRGAQISATYAKIASSDMIADRAKDSLDPSTDTSGTSVSSEPVTGTNVLEITVTGPDPAVAAALARAVGEETVNEINSADDPYELLPLDEPTVPAAPASPNKPLTIAVGVVFGLLFGVGLALFIEYLKAPPPLDDRTLSRSPRVPAWSESNTETDPLTGLASERFIAERVTQEVSRAKHHGDVFSLGVLRVALAADDGAGSRLVGRDDLQIIADAIRPTGRDEDVLARIGATSYVGLLPGMDLSTAEWTVLEWEAVLTELGEGVGTDTIERLRLSTSVCEYRDETFHGDRDAISVARRLLAGRRSVSHATSTPSPSGERVER